MKLVTVERSSSKSQRKRQDKKVKNLGRQAAHDFSVKDSGSHPEIVRRTVLVQINGTTALTGGSVYGAANSNAVTVSSEFTAIANQGLYREFRVVAMRARISALWQHPVSDSQTAGLGCLVGSVCTGNNVPPNDVKGLLSGQGARISTRDLPFIQLEVDSGANPNAKLWSSVNTGGASAITPDNWLSVGWKFTNTVPAGFNNKTVTFECYEYDVEFRTAG